MAIKPPITGPVENRLVSNEREVMQELVDEGTNR